MHSGKLQAVLQTSCNPYNILSFPVVLNTTPELLLLFEQKLSTFGITLQPTRDPRISALPGKLHLFILRYHFMVSKWVQLILVISDWFFFYYSLMKIHNNGLQIILFFLFSIILSPIFGTSYLLGIAHAKPLQFCGYNMDRLPPRIFDWLPDLKHASHIKCSHLTEEKIELAINLLLKWNHRYLSAARTVAQQNDMCVAFPSSVIQNAAFFDTEITSICHRIIDMSHSDVRPVMRVLEEHFCSLEIGYVVLWIVTDLQSYWFYWISKEPIYEYPRHF